MSLFRRALVTAAVAAGFALVGPAPMVFAQVSAAVDLNCGDFQYQEEAQAILDATPGDPNNLDSDHDGIACESLPHRGSQPGTTTPPATTPAQGTKAPPVTTKTSDKDCADFPSQAAAQAELNKDRRDPNKLDADHDGYACESRFGEPKKSGQVKVKPVGGVATGGGGEADNTNGLVLVAGASTAALASAGLVLLLRRRTS